LQDPIESKKFSVAITGADYSEKLNRLILIGYNNPTGDSSIDRNVEQIKNFKVQIIEIDNIDIELFSPRQKTQTNNIINALEVLQAESISFSEKSNKYFIASEQSLKTPKFPARIYSYFK
jgi:hypothetical protein